MPFVISLSSDVSFLHIFDNLVFRRLVFLQTCVGSNNMLLPTALK